MLTSFEDLQKAYVKATPVIVKEENGQTPRFYTRCLVELEDFINEMWEDRDGRKSMSKNNSKSLGSMRQKLRKYLKDFDEDLAKFRENPDQPDEEEEEEKREPEADSDSEVPAKPAAKQAERKVSPDDDEDSDSDDWPSDSESDESSSDDEKFTSIREKFLKKTGGTQEDDEEKQRLKEERRKDRKDKERRKAKREEDDDGDGEWETVKGGVAIPSEKPKMFAKDAEIDLSLVIKKLSEIMAARGKKRTDRREQIELLHELQNISELHQLGPAISVKIKFAIISSIFDYNPKVSDAMKPEYWTK